MSNWRELAIGIAFLVACFLLGAVGCATVPRDAKMIFDCTSHPCSVADPKPAYHVDDEDPNACKNPERKRDCTEL